MHKKKLKLTKNTWQYLYTLLNSGMSLQEALLFLEIEHATQFYEIYIEKQKGKFYENLKFFYPVHTLEKTIEHSLALEQFKKNMLHQLTKTLFYPLVILIMACSILYFFSSFVIPQLGNHFDVNQELFVIFKYIPIVFHCILLFLFLLCFFIGVIVIWFKKLWLFIIRKMIQKFGFVRYMYSYYFIGYYTVLYECGLSNKQIIEYLLHLNQNNVVYHIVHGYYMQLQKGHAIENIIQISPFLAKEVKYSFYLGLNTNKLQLFLKQSKQFCLEKMLQHLKIAMLIVQVLAYSMVVMIVIFIYNMMLLPLEMVQKF